MLPSSDLFTVDCFPLMGCNKTLFFIVHSMNDTIRWKAALSTSFRGGSFIEWMTQCIVNFWWMSHLYVGSMKSLPYGYSMKSCFNEKPLRWKAAPPPVLLWLLVLLLAATTILSVKAAESIHPTRLPCRPTYWCSCSVEVDCLETSVPRVVYFSFISTLSITLSMGRHIAESHGAECRGESILGI